MPAHHRALRWRAGHHRSASRTHYRYCEEVVTVLVRPLYTTVHVVASYYTTRRTTSYRGGGLNSDGQYLRILLVLDLASTSVATSRYRYTIPVPFKVPSLRLGPLKPL